MATVYDLQRKIEDRYYVFRPPTIGDVKKIIAMTKNTSDPSAFIELVDMFEKLVMDERKREEFREEIESIPLDQVETLFKLLGEEAFGRLQKKSV